MTGLGEAVSSLRSQSSSAGGCCNRPTRSGHGRRGCRRLEVRVEGQEAEAPDVEPVIAPFGRGFRDWKRCPGMGLRQAVDVVVPEDVVARSGEAREDGFDLPEIAQRLGLVGLVVLVL